MTENTNLDTLYINENLNINLENKYLNHDFPTKTQLENAADEYKMLNWISIPLNNSATNKEGKVPCIKNWQNLDIDTEINWEYAKNIGVLCGKKSGIVCLDIDKKDRGVEIFNKLISKYGIIDGPVEITPNGGYHYIFEYNNKIKHLKSDSKMVKLNGETIGIDLKTNGGQFVVTPSVNRQNKKAYMWIKNRHPEDIEVPEMPDWLVDLLTYGNLDDELNIVEPSSIKNSKKNDLNNDNKQKNRRTFENTDAEYMWHLLILLPVSEWDDYTSWLNLGMIIFNFYEGNELSTYKVWGEFSKISKKYDGDKIEEKIRTFKNEGKLLGLSTLEKKVQEYKPIEYQNLRNRFRKQEDVNVRSDFNSNDQYCWLDFHKEFNGKVFEDEQDMLDNILPNLKRVFAIIEHKAGYVVRKEDCEDNIFTIVDRNKKFTKMNFNYAPGKTNDKGKEKNKNINIKFTKFIDVYLNSIPMYGGICCKPINNENNRAFNVWQGYRAKIVEEVDMTKVQPWLDFIKEIWANNDETVYNYLITWLYYILIRPETMTKVAIFAHSANQGVGKNTFTDFLHQYVIGNHTCGEVSGLEPLVKNFNKILEGKKLVIVNETSSAKDAFYANFNKMKNIITDKSLYIEPKGREAYNVDNLLNLIIFSNHANAIMLEKTDRRYLCLDINEKYMQNTKFFKNLHETIMNQECANHFYTYFINYDPDNLVNVFIPPVTELKQDLIDSNIPSPIKFLKYIKGTSKDWNATDMTMLGKDLYNKYISWCQDNNEKAISAKTFGLNIRNNIDKYMVHGYNKYKIDTIKNV